MPARRRVSTLTAIAFLATTMVGCASWKASPKRKVVTKKATVQVPTNPKLVLLEVEFINLDLDENDPDASESLWQWIDETKVDAENRQRLLANGIRVGYVANEQRLRKRMSDSSGKQDVVEKFLAEASIASDVSHGTKRIPMRLGKRHELPLHQPIAGSHVALIRLDNETIGKTLADAQYLYSITATSAANQKQIHLRMTPEIQHGDMRQKWVGSDSALRIDTRRETWAIPELDLNVLATEGETLAIAPTSPVRGLGKQMLTGSSAELTTQQVMMLIHVSQVPTAVDML
ncbi:MAG: hypothetical protein AB8B91_18425 [Rubripirellula sp.]